MSDITRRAMSRGAFSVLFLSVGVWFGYKAGYKTGEKAGARRAMFTNDTLEHLWTDNYGLIETLSGQHIQRK